MTESVEDIVRSFIDKDLAALDAFGEVSAVPSGAPESPMSNASPHSSIPFTPHSPIPTSIPPPIPTRKNREMKPRIPSYTSPPLSPTSAKSHELNSNGSSPVQSRRFSGQLTRFRKPSNTSITSGSDGTGSSSSGTKMASKFKLFGRRIVSSSAATTNPTSAALANSPRGSNAMQQFFRSPSLGNVEAMAAPQSPPPPPPKAKVPAINMYFGSEKS